MCYYNKYDKCKVFTKELLGNQPYRTPMNGVEHIFHIPEWHVDILCLRQPDFAQKYMCVCICIYVYIAYIQVLVCATFWLKIYIPTLGYSFGQFWALLWVVGQMGAHTTALPAPYWNVTYDYFWNIPCTSHFQPRYILVWLNNSKSCCCDHGY